MRQKRRRKSKVYIKVSRLDFKELMYRNRLTTAQTAEMLHVNERTVRLWLKGVSRIPYSAFKLLRIMANGEFINDQWEGWQVRGDTLWTPAGRGFKPYQLLYLSNYMQMARLWIKDRERITRGRTMYRIPPQLRIVTSQEKIRAVK